MCVVYSCLVVRASCCGGISCRSQKAGYFAVLPAVLAYLHGWDADASFAAHGPEAHADGVPRAAGV